MCREFCVNERAQVCCLESLAFWKDIYIVLCFRPSINQPQIAAFMLVQTMVEAELKEVKDTWSGVVRI